MTVPAGPTHSSRAAVRAAVESARRRLLDSQNEDGYWRAGQPTQVEITAEDLLFRHSAGLWDGGLAEATARWLREQQYPAGGWPSRDGGPPDRCASVLAYCALRLAGDSPDAYHMAVAAGWIRDAGGLPAADMRARIWLAMLGEADWHALRIPRPEGIYLPQRHPVRIAGGGGWGRPTVVPLTVLGALRPVRPLPFGLPELRVPVPGSSDTARPVRTAGLDPLSPRGPGRSAALTKCAARILADQQADGSWRADGPGWLYSLLALQLLGTSSSEPALARGLAALDASAVWAQAPAGPLRLLDLGGRAVQSTADAVLALSDAGLPAENHALAAAGRWLLGQELRARSGWLAGQRDPSDRAHVPAGGMRAAASDTASVLLALRRVGPTPSERQRQALACSIRWLASIQGRDGGWSGDADRRTAASAQLTGQVLAGLAAAGQPGSAAVRRAAVCLLRQQLPDGSWPPDQAADGLDATSAVLPALVAAGVRPEKSQLRRAVAWLAQSQNPDGGWGSAGHGPPGAHGLPGAHGPADAHGEPGAHGSDPLPTADVLLALLAAGGSDAADVIYRGVSWLTRAQLGDGSWTDARPDRGSDPGQGSDSARMLSTPVRALSRYLSAVVSGASVPVPRPGHDGRIPAVTRDLSR
jgi:squalene-hopene/tetraprenyl-beta-curcumene cyclase